MIALKTFRHLGGARRFAFKKGDHLDAIDFPPALIEQWRAGGFIGDAKPVIKPKSSKSRSK